VTLDFPVSGSPLRGSCAAIHGLPLSPLFAERGLLLLKGRRAGQRNSTRWLPCLYLRGIRRTHDSDRGREGIGIALES
jgi:hypothetical protein